MNARACIVVLSVGIVVSACGDGTEPTPPLAPTSSVTSAAPSPTPSTSPEPGSNPAGSPFRYDSGLTVAITAVERFEPSPVAVGYTPGQAAILVRVSIENGSTEEVGLDLNTVEVHAGSTKAEQIFDTPTEAPDMGAGFSGALAPGDSATATFGFSLAEEAVSQETVEVLVTPRILDDPARFEVTVPA